MTSSVTNAQTPSRASYLRTIQPQECARYAALLFTLSVALQRFAVPGITVIPLLLPLVAAWLGWGLWRGLLVVDRTRLMWWALAAAACLLTVPAQQQLLAQPYDSVGSVALFLVVWAPGIFALAHRGREVYLQFLRSVVRVTSWLALGCTVMMISQFAGLAYRDWLALALPDSVLLQGFVITYPVVWDSPIYRANAWIGLEPSIVSLQMGVGLVAAILTRAAWKHVIALSVGLICATAGSGIAIAAVAVLIMAFHPFRANLWRYVPAGLGGLVLLWAAPWGSAIYSRVTEAGNSSSSTSLRAILPYEYLWPHWVADPMALLIGRGAGYSQDLVMHSGIEGLLVPTPAKLFFDYGLFAGLALGAFIMICYLGSPSRALAGTLAVSLWLLQPGTTVVVIVVLVFLMATWWAPGTTRLEATTPLEATGRLEEPAPADLTPEVTR